jgi:NADH-quinone oxidoreductase subunit J
MFQQLMFYVFATLAVVAGFFVISGKNPISCAVALVVTLGSVAGLFVLLDAHFVATIQVLVYAGAIMVLFIFVIMLLNLHPDELGPPQITVLKGVGCALAGAGLVLLVWKFLPVGGTVPPVPDEYGTLQQIGLRLFKSYLLPFEIVSALLTAAVVGAVVIAKRDL